MDFKLLRRSRKGIIAEEVKPEDADSEAPAGRAARDATATAKHGQGAKSKAWLTPARAEASVESKAAMSPPQQLGYNQYSKFTQIHDAPILWREAAEALASYASEVHPYLPAFVCLSPLTYNI